MQRIRKERSPAPAYVMPSSYCQPAPAPFCLPGGRGRVKARALSTASRRKILIAPISIFGRSFACSLFDDAGATNNIPVVASCPNRFPSTLFTQPGRGTRICHKKACTNARVSNYGRTRNVIASLHEQYIYI